jgi:1-deoxy-D-xylulose-5-phosphate synthase
VAKTIALGDTNIFEALGIRYFGPVDGHDLVHLTEILSRLKNINGPVLLHVVTRKGKGLKQAEQNPIVYHAPGLFDAETGERTPSHSATQSPSHPLKYLEVFGHTIIELAEQNPAIVGITPAMATGCSLNMMMEQMPDRTFDLGISEQHAVTFAAGLAAQGMVPFCNIYSSFAQRAFDNIIHDVALCKLPVVFCFDRAGLVGQDGATHHGAFDLAALRPIPNITISSPMDEHELRRLMYTAQLPNKGPFVIRYPRGGGVLVNWRCPLEEIKVGTGRKLHDGNDVAVLSIGPIGNNVAEAIESLSSQASEANIPSAAHYDMRFLKPIDETILQEVAENFNRIITVENGVKTGGLGSAVIEWMNDHGYHPEIVRLGLPDTEFVEHGTVDELHHIVGLDKEAIIKAIKGI